MSFRMVNGKEVENTPAEDAARTAEEAIEAPKLARRKIQITFDKALQDAQETSGLSDSELELYQDMYQEIKERQRNSSVDTEQLDQFAQDRGISKGDAATFIRSKIRPYKLAKGAALAERQNAIDAM